MKKAPHIKMRKKSIKRKKMNPSPFFGPLAPYAMKAGESKGRRYPEEEHPYRSAFQRDRERIIHSTAFRRLEYKTQVFINHEGDYYRTRLTHTLEVAQISRSLARALRLNEDLAEAIALAHDLGHTPFGHSGEKALQELMQEYGGFEHNRQGLRVVEELETRYPEFPGLNLTWEVREGIIKHKTTYDCPHYQEYQPEKSPSLEAQLVNIADEIAYSNHDLDDGLTAGYLHEKELQEISLWRQIYNRVERRYPALDKERKKYQTIKLLINAQVGDLIEETKKHIRLGNIDDIKAVQDAQILVRFSPRMQKKNLELKDFLLRHLYSHYKVVRMAEKSRRFIAELFHAYISCPGQLSFSMQEKLKKVKSKKEIARLVCDYIAGMTDRYAQEEYTKLFMPYERM